MRDLVRVLLIDDDEADRLVVRRGLQQAGLKVETTEAATAAAGVAAFREGTFDCVFLDYRLPDMDGMTTLKSLLDTEDNSAAIIVLTGQGNERLALEMMEVGAVDYLTKDEIGPSVLKRSVRYALARQQFRETRQDLLHRLVVANEELETFCYSVSHDLRAPLRGIDGFCQALQEDCSDQLNALGKQYVKRVRSATDRMTALIDNLLQMSKVNRSELSENTVSLTEIARSVTEELRQAEPDREVSVKIEEGIAVNGDLSLLSAALQNLLDNAWKFTSPRTKAKITFGSTSEGDGQCTYFVTDNGIGFDMTFADRLAVPFHRFENARNFEGTGIGLATVDRIIRRHGGRLWAKSAPNEGATFYFTLGERKKA